MNKKEYKPLIMPTVQWNVQTASSVYGELVAQPLEPGFGATLGNALRRVLLGAVEGAAVTSVIIHGVNNEFSSLPGVVEDAMQVILNIKELVVKSIDGLPGKMVLEARSAGPVYARALQTDSNIEIINKDLLIATLASDGIIKIEFFVESGRGYQTAAWPTGKPLQEDGRIYIDAMFSPVRSITFDVEKTRVGKEIDYDKLTLKVTTDGSETPFDVLHYAASVLRTQLNNFLIDAPEITFHSVSSPLQEKAVGSKAVTNGASQTKTSKHVPAELLMKPIEELELTVRAHNCLLSAGIKKVSDLVSLPEDEALKIKNFGRKSLNEVKESLQAFGLTFGMNVADAELHADDYEDEDDHDEDEE
jgi:DNA-directed RNA polymerase subunit alpha